MVRGRCQGAERTPIPTLLAKRAGVSSIHPPPIGGDRTGLGGGCGIEMFGLILADFPFCYY